MIKASIKLQDLRRKIYTKAKAEQEWRFWGLYVHVYKMETLEGAYKIARQNKGTAGIDGITFEMIEAEGVEKFLTQIQSELKAKTYKPSRKRVQAIPKDNGKNRKISIPTIKDRVVEGAMKLILEPIFEADFQPGSYGYRPKRTAAQAIETIALAAIQGKTKAIEVDLRSYFDTIAHAKLFEKVAERVNDKEVMRLLKMLVKSGGKRGISQGSPLSPLLSNIYLNEVDKMLERAKKVTKENTPYGRVEYARWADDLLVLIDGHEQWNWLEGAVQRRIREELDKIKVELNEEKTRIVDIRKGESFSFLGFDFRRKVTRQGKRSVEKTPRMKARTKLLRRLKEIFSHYLSQPTERLLGQINPILRGWLNYFRIGNSSRCFSYIKQWVEKKLRRHLMRAKKRKGFGWKRWSRRELYEMGLYNDYQIRHYSPLKATPAR